MSTAPTEKFGTSIAPTPCSVAGGRELDDVLVGPTGRPDHRGNAVFERTARDVDRDRIDGAVDDDVHADAVERIERIVDRRLTAASDVLGQAVPAAGAPERSDQTKIVRRIRLQRDATRPSRPSAPATPTRTELYSL